MPTQPAWLASIPSPKQVLFTEPCDCCCLHPNIHPAPPRGARQAGTHPPPPGTAPPPPLPRPKPTRAAAPSHELHLLREPPHTGPPGAASTCMSWPRSNSGAGRVPCMQCGHQGVQAPDQPFPLHIAASCRNLTRLMGTTRAPEGAKATPCPWVSVTSPTGAGGKGHRPKEHQSSLGNICEREGREQGQAGGPQGRQIPMALHRALDLTV